jgi:hypothetical protein
VSRRKEYAMDRIVIMYLGQSAYAMYVQFYKNREKWSEDE